MQKEKIVYIIFILVIAGLLLLQFSNQNDNKFVLASEKAITSVVTIYTSNNTDSLRNSYQRSRYANTKNIGSGVIISQEGHIVTNSHLLIPNGKIIIGHKNGEMSEGILVGKEQKT